MFNIITAFKSEAQPFIKHFCLDFKESMDNCDTYIGNEIQLCVSGMGTDNATKATRLMLSGDFVAADAWLNFGIAGSGENDIGSLVLADTVHDMRDRQYWELEVPQIASVGRGTVCTVPSPCSDYDGHVTYEMEAAGILAELPKSMVNSFFCLKLISDGPHRSAEKLTRGDIVQLITTAKPDIIAVTERIFQIHHH